MSDRIKSILTLLPVALLLASAPGEASGRDTANIGDDGRLYTVTTGAYGDLFPGQGLADEDSAVLALDVRGPAGSNQRFLVPGTESDNVEDSASMVFEDGSGTLFILWQTRINLIHSSLNLVSFRDGAWSPVIEIWGSPFGWKMAPQFAVTRDQFVTIADDGSRRTWSRSVVHVIWAEEDEYGPHILYSPIVLVDGAFEGRSPVFGLAELAGLREGFLGGMADPAIAAGPRIEPGRNGQSVVIGFVDAASDRLATLEIEVLPGEVSHLAERLRHQIVDLGRGLLSGDRVELADKLRHQIVDLGRSIELHPGLTTYAAAVVAEDLLAADPSEPVASIADRLRHQIVDLGARNTGRGVDRTLAKTGYGILEIAQGEGAEAEMAPNLLRISTASVREAPRAQGMAAPVSFHLSRGGENVIVAWGQGDRIDYVESQGSGWSEPLAISIGPAGVSSVERAHDILGQRAESRRTDR